MCAMYHQGGGTDAIFWGMCVTIRDRSGTDLYFGVCVLSSGQVGRGTQIRSYISWYVLHVRGDRLILYSLRICATPVLPIFFTRISHHFIVWKRHFPKDSQTSQERVFIFKCQNLSTMHIVQCTKSSPKPGFIFLRN